MKIVDVKKGKRFDEIRAAKKQALIDKEIAALRKQIKIYEKALMEIIQSTGMGRAHDIASAAVKSWIKGAGNE